MKKLFLSFLLIAGISATTFASDNLNNDYSTIVTSYSQQAVQESDLDSRTIADTHTLNTIDLNSQSYEMYYYGFGTTCGYTAVVRSNRPLSDTFVTNLSVAIEYAFCTE